MEAKKMLENMKKRIDSRLQQQYALTTINHQPFFITKTGTPFHVVNLYPFLKALVVEYADTWEDGDCFFIDELSEDEIFDAILKELDETS